MKLINKRFKIIKKVNNTSNGDFFLVKDIFNNERKLLKIYNTDKYPKNKINNFKKEFIFIRNIDLPCINEADYYSNIWNIDNNNFNSDYFFYTLKKNTNTTNLSSYKFISKEEKLKIFKYIQFYLQYLHKNNFYHGNLSSKNIQITKNKQIIFTKTNINGSQKKDNKNFNKLLKDYDIKKEDLEKIKIDKNQIFQFMKKKYKFKFNFNPILKNKLNENFDDIIKSNKSIIFSLNNFNNYYFASAEYFLQSKFLLENYTVFNIKRTPDLLDILKKFIKDINKTKKFKSVIKKNKKFVQMIFNEEINNLSLKKIFLFLKNILEEISFISNIAIFLNSFDIISKDIVKEFISFLNKYSGKKIIIIINDNKFILKKGLKNKLFDYKIFSPSPINDENSKKNLNKLMNLFYFIDIGKNINILKKYNYYNIYKIIKYILNIFSKNSKKAKNLLNENSLTELIHSNYYILDYYYNSENKQLLSLIVNMDKPVNKKYLKPLIKNLNEEVKNLIDANILKYTEHKYITFENVDYNDYIHELFKTQDKNFQDKIHNKIIKIYENYIEDLNIDELIALGFNYFFLNKHEKLKSLLINYFIRNYSLNRSFLKPKVKILLKKLKKNMDNMKKANINHRAIYLIAHTVFVFSDDIEKRKNQLLTIEQLNIEDNKIKFIIIKELFEIYDKLDNHNKLDDYFNKASMLLPYLDFINQIYVYNMLIDYYFTKNQSSMVKKMCNLIMSKIYNKKQKYKYMYLNILNKLGSYYSSTNQKTKELNTYKILLNKARKYNYPKYIMNALNGIGVINFYRGNYTKAKENFYQIQKIASEIYDYNYLIISNINLALVNPNFEDVKDYYIKALNYADKIEKKDSILLLLNNLFEIISDKKLYNLIKKYNHIIKDENASLINFRQYGHFYYTVIFLLMRIDKMDQLFEYYNILKNLNISEKNNFYNYHKLLLTLYERVIADMNIDYSLLSNFLYNIPNNFIKNYIHIIFIWFYKSFSNNQKIDWLNTVYKKLELEKYNNYKKRIKVLIDIETDNITKKTIETINKIKFDLQEVFDIYLYIYFSIYKSIFNHSNKQNYCNLISFIITYFQNFTSKFKNKNLLDLTIFPSLQNLIKQKYPKLYNDIYKNQNFTNIKLKNNSSFFDKIHFQKQDNNDKFMKNILNMSLYKINYDRGIFFSLNNTKIINKIKVVKDKLIYANNKKVYFDRYFKKLNKNTLIKSFKNKPINKIVLIPILDNNILKRYEYNKKLDPKYIKGVLYFDKKNTINSKSKKTIFKFLQVYLSQYWEKYLIQNKYLKDDLTKLYLKNEFIKRSKEYINNDNIKNKNYSIIMADIDNFKSINDTFGHQKGDEILKKIAAIIKKNVRSFDIAARYGGEEFIIGLENTDINKAVIIAERIRKKIKNAKLMKNIREVTISLGVSNLPVDSFLLSDLINKADNRLYKAKNTGKNKVCYK